MSSKTQDEKAYNRLSDFYEGKSVFITGAAGYLGSIIMHILLSHFPGIQNIYLLLRAKKSVEPESRKSLIFQKRIFTELLEKYPDLVDKVHVIPGEITKPNLGISDKNLLVLAENVSIVFHCAATLSFIKPLRFTVLQNSVGTNNIVKFCRKLQKCDALVYTSTAYSNANREIHIAEKIYRLPFNAERYLEDFVHGNDGKFESLVAQCKPEWPNDYTFSKCLAENVLQDNASDLPVAIIRPSIIITTWKNPLPGYIEEGTGIVDLGVAVGKGFARVIYGNPDVTFDLIPSDVTANAHITAAWSVATGRTSSPLVVNCTGGHAWKITFGEYCRLLENLAKKYPLPKSFQSVSLKMVNSKFLYWPLAIYEHYIPAVSLDIILYFKGSKLRLWPLYRFLDVIMNKLKFFTNKTIDFEVNNFLDLTQQMHPEDRELFYMDLEGIDAEEITYKLPFSSPFYDWKRDNKTLKKRQQIVYMQTMMINFIKRSVIVFICWLLYLFISKLFW